MELAENRQGAAGHASRKRGPGRPRRRWIIHVKSIEPGKYPELERNPENPFSYLDPEARMEEIISFCARLWARTCQEMVRRRSAEVEAKGGNAPSAT